MKNIVDILVEGKPVKFFAHENRTYIQANKGSNYSIKLKNNTPNRQMFVISIDGINVINGKPSGASDNMGYVISGYSNYELKGFRTSNEEVHPFKFNDKIKSYAAKSDDISDVSNCGVIGVKVFDEKVKPQPEVIVKHHHHYHKEKEYVPINPWPLYPDNPWMKPMYNPTFTCKLDNNSHLYGNTNYSPNAGIKGQSMGQMTNCCNNSSNTSCSSLDDEIVQDSAFDTGTEFSQEAVKDKVTDTQFDIGLLLDTIEIYYSSRDGLRKLGVPLEREVKIAMPQAWPDKFCKIPKQ